MAVGSNIRTYFNGTWHEGNPAVMRAADHGAWLGTTVFDGARYFDGYSPDLEAHCARINRSANALMLTPTVETAEMVEIVREGLGLYDKSESVYIRPMYWGIDGDMTTSAIAPAADETGFAICLEVIPMAPATASTTLTRTRFRRPVLEDAVVDAKAGCLYPNNARMLKEAKAKALAMRWWATRWVTSPKPPQPMYSWSRMARFSPRLPTELSCRESPARVISRTCPPMA